MLYIVPCSFTKSLPFFSKLHLNIEKKTCEGEKKSCPRNIFVAKIHSFLSKIKIQKKKKWCNTLKELVLNKLSNFILTFVA